MIIIKDKIYIYKFREGCRDFGIQYQKENDSLQVSLYFWNIIILFD